MNILSRMLTLINTDPQRRCYDGVNAKEEIVWTAWTILEYDVPPDRVEPRLKFWRELNDYAVKERGRVGTLREYKAEKTPEEYEHDYQHEDI